MYTSNSLYPRNQISIQLKLVGFECWASSRRIYEFMRQHNMTKYPEVEQFYIQRIVDIAKNLSRKSIVWQEVFENGVQLAPETVVHIWTGNR